MSPRQSIGSWSTSRQNCDVDLDILRLRTAGSIEPQAVTAEDWS